MHNWGVDGCRGGSAHRAPPAAKDENKSTKTRSAWGGKVADLSKEKGQEPFLQWAFIGVNLHRNTGRIYVKLINHCQAEMTK